MNQPSIGSDIGLAFFCFDQKFYNQAIMIAEKAKEKTQDNILLNFILAECYLGTGQFALAINELLVINNVFKESYALRFYLSQAYTKAGMMEEASETYMLLTEDRPDFVMADLVYGKILADFSKWEEAKKVYENGLNYMPYSGDLQTSLGWVLLHLDELENFENLLTIIEKNKNIALVSVLHLKGWAAFKRNDYLKAEEFLMQAIEQAPGDPEICYHLGMVMLAIGKKETARNLLRQSMLFEKQRNKYKDETKKAFL